MRIGLGGFEESHGGVGFTSAPELGFFASPKVYDTPFAITDDALEGDAFASGFVPFVPPGATFFELGDHKDFIDVAPDGSAESAFAIHEVCPRGIEGLSPKFADAGVCPEGFVGVAGDVDPFVKEGGVVGVLEVCAGYAGAGLVVLIAGDFGIVKAEEIVSFLVLGDGSGVAEDDGAGGVELFGFVVGGLEVAPVDAFVADGPEENGGMIAEGLNHFDDLPEVAIGIGGVVLRGGVFVIVGEAVSLDEADGGFAFDIEAKLVTVFEESFGGGIVGGADEVHVRGFEQLGVAFVDLVGSYASQGGMNIMTTGTAKLNGLSVHEHFIADDLHLAESDLALKGVSFLALFEDGDGEGVEVWVLGIPFLGR